METRITARLRDQLGTAKNANEMFRIFSRFNALFVRPHIRGAIREYQTQLIQRVKDDIEALHDKFKVQDSTVEFIRIDQLFILWLLAKLSLSQLESNHAKLHVYIHCTIFVLP